jgi:hypothetical protein
MPFDRKKYYLNNKAKQIKSKNVIVMSDTEKYKKQYRKYIVYQEKYRKKNREKINQKIREWYYKNKDRVRANQRIYEREGAYRNSLHFKIKDGMRKRILEVLKRDGGKKTQRTMKLVGCTVEELKQHIEKKFKPGMSWEQRHLFHIDHIIPCASFDLTKLSQQKKCFHYTNLQPLWAIDNIKKGAKLNYEPQQ